MVYETVLNPPSDEFELTLSGPITAACVGNEAEIAIVTQKQKNKAFIGSFFRIIWVQTGIKGHQS